MGISKDQEELYKKTLEDVRSQLSDIDAEVEKELQRVSRPWLNCRSRKNH
jgi:hypothetical protein